MKEDIGREVDVNEMNLSLNGCGYLGIYHVGVCSCFKKHCPQVLNNNISGGSVGALVACAFMCDVPLATCAKYVFDVSMRVRDGILGPLSPDLDIMALLRTSMRAMLPPDAHARADGKLHVSVTRVDDVTNVLLTRFRTRDELLQALMCSCFIPVYCGYEPPEFHGVAYADSALSNNNPWLDAATVTVAPFSGDSHICPERIRTQRDGLLPNAFRLSNTSIGLSARNFYMLFRVLFPAAPDIQQQICQQGYDDALRFLRDKGLVQCQDCGLKRQGHKLCKPPHEAIQEEISNEIERAIEEFRKNLAYRLFQYRSMKMLYYLNMPSIVTAKVAYVAISTLLQRVQNKTVPRVDDIWSQLLRILKDGLYYPKKRIRLPIQSADATPVCHTDDDDSPLSSTSSSFSDNRAYPMDVIDEESSDENLSTTVSMTANLAMNHCSREAAQTNEMDKCESENVKNCAF